MITTKCDGCRYHSKDPDADIWIYEDAITDEEWEHFQKVLEMIL